MDKNKEIRRAKIINYIVLFTILLIVAFICFGLLYNKYNHAFTTSKWMEDPSKRVYIVDNLLSKYNLENMTENEILELLGPDSGEKAYFQEDDNFVYYLGNERSFFSIDSEWLIIDFKDGRVTNYEVRTD